MRTQLNFNSLNGVVFPQVGDVFRKIVCQVFRLLKIPYSLKQKYSACTSSWILLPGCVCLQFFCSGKGDSTKNFLRI